MIGIDVVIAQLPGLLRPDLERWILLGWVRPDGAAGGYAFREVDVARVRLIRELRDEMDVNEDTLPLVLSLLDQLYDVRRRMRELTEALDRTASEDVRKALAAHLANRE
jgi:chaperone modulatory protein CbpM